MSSYLIISQYFAPESFRINELASELHARGNRVFVLTGQPNYPSGKILLGYSAYKAGRDSQFDFAVYRVPLVPRGQGRIFLILNYISFMLMASLLGPWLLRGIKFDHVFYFGVSPITAAFPGLLISWIKKSNFIYWVQDLWPESLEATNYLKNRFVLETVSGVVNFIYGRSSLILCQSEALCELVSSRSPRSKVAYLPNFFEQSERIMPSSIKLDCDKFNIVFAGNIGKAQGLELVLQGVKNLIESSPHIKFHFVGDGSEKQKLLALSATDKITNVKFWNSIDIREIPSLLNNASAVLLSLGATPLSKSIVPSKLQAYLCYGCPILCVADGESSRIVRASGAGFVSSPGDNVGFVKNVLTLSSLKEWERKEIVKNGKSKFEQEYTLGSIIDRLEKECQKLGVVE